MQVQKFFKPELLNRMSEIVIFEPLLYEQMKEVAKIQIKNVVSRVADKGISLSTSSTVLDVILSEPHNPVSTSSLFSISSRSLAIVLNNHVSLYMQMYGARPIRRWVQKNIMTILSEMLVRGEVSEGSTIFIDATDNKKGLKYEVVKTPVMESSSA
jgi:ATP-dependent Clp protease ATP-binding subunit ClpA